MYNDMCIFMFETFENIKTYFKAWGHKPGEPYKA